MKTYIFSAALMLAIVAQPFLVAQDKNASANDKQAAKEPAGKKTVPAEMKDEKSMMKKGPNAPGPGRSLWDDKLAPSDKAAGNLSEDEVARLLEMVKDKGPLGEAARKQLKEAMQAIDRKGILPLDEISQDFVILDDSRPLLVRVHPQVDGRPLQAAWNDFVTHLFRYADLDNDGFLSEKELDLIPSLDQLLGGGSPFGFGYRGNIGQQPMTLSALDTNHDGKVSIAELAAYYRKSGFTPFQVEAPPDQDMGMRFGLGFVNKEPSIEAVSDAIFTLIDANRDGRITREELAAAGEVLRRMDTNEDDLLTTREIAPNARANSGKGAMMGGMMGRGGPRNTRESGHSKIILLKNGEAVKASSYMPSNGYDKVYMGMEAPRKDGSGPAAVTELKADKAPAESELARRLQERYSRKGKQEPTFLGEMIDEGLRSMGLAKVETAADRARDMLLTRADLGLDEATFALLDTNKDGRLDARELAVFAKRAPDVELIIRLGTRKPGQDRVEVVVASSVSTPAFPKLGPQGAPPEIDIKLFLDEKPPSIKIEREGDIVTKISVASGKQKKKSFVAVSAQKDFAMVDLGKTRIELRGKDGPKAESMNVFSRQQNAARFKRADMNGNGYIEEQDAERYGFNRSMFKAMDRNGDGKVTEQEFYTYLDLVENLQKRAREACVTLVLTDESRGLFDLIDTNRDGKLSIRELRGAVKLLDSLDRTGRGYITRADVPKSNRLTVRLGAANSRDDSEEAQIAAIYGISMVEEEEAPTAGPAWFRKMDKNRDGDVSLSEWLGSEELFRRIDTDGDGLISVQEAEAYDALQRQQKK